MKVWYNRNKNRILAFLCAFIMGVGICCQDLTAHASNVIYVYMPFDKPSVTTNTGYIELYYSDGTIQCLFWGMYPDSETIHSDHITWTGEYPILSLDINLNNNVVVFDFYLGTDIIGYVSLNGFDSNHDFMMHLHEKTFTTNSQYAYQCSKDLVWVQAYGNLGSISYSSNQGHGFTNVYPVYSSDVATVDLLLDIYTQLSISNNFYEVYFPKLNQILLNITQIEDINQALLDLQNEMMPQFLEYFEKIYNDHGEMLSSIDSSTYAIWRAIVEQNSTDSDLVNDLKENSNAQSNDLNNLNQTMEEEQNRTDIDSASSEVDANLDLEAVGSYGTLLSAFTTNEYVVQILLAALSVGLISYVFFGRK